MSDKADVFVVAGEASGDLIASLLAKELLARRPDLRIAGLGGSQLEAAGARVLRDIVSEFAIIGLGDVLANLRRLRRLFLDTIAAVERARPEVVVLVDYPGFNLRLARALSARGFRVVYYVIPQVWAWKSGRVKILRDCCAKTLVILPFEKRFLAERGCDSEFVGHPLFDTMRITMNREEVCAKFGLDPARPIVGLLPGSRRREIESLLPVMLGAAKRLRERRPELQFVIPRAKTIGADVLREWLDRFGFDATIVDSNRYSARAQFEFAMVASGTATLETGLLGTPMVVLYKVAPLTWHLGRMLVKLPGIGLINIVAEERLAPELLQGDCTEDKVFAASEAILGDPKESARLRERLAAVKERLGGPGASARAAEAVLATMGERTRSVSEPESPAGTSAEP